MNRNCGVDDTCVLCCYCYNPDDHVGHQVSIFVSNGTSGGVCDCGDAEAWTTELSCKHYNVENKEEQPVPAELEQAILSTVETSLDFVIDVLSRSDITLQRDDIPQQVLERIELATLSSAKYGEEDDFLDGSYALIIWNDQTHTFTEVEELINTHLGKDSKFCEEVAMEVDQYGRGLLHVSEDLEGLLSTKGKMEATGLVHTIQSTRDYFREEMCDTIIHWLGDIAASSFKDSNTFLPEIVSKAMCDTWSIGLRNREDETAGTLVASSLYYQKIPPPGMFAPLPADIHTDLGSPARPALHSPPPSYWLEDGPTHPTYLDPKHQLHARVQYLMFFHCRLWTSLRTTLRDIYISALIPSPKYKPILAECFIEIYPTLCDLYVFSDREKECANLSNLAVQLLTTPSIATNILKYDNFSRILACFYTFFTQLHIGSVDCVNIFSPPAVPSEYINYRHGYIAMFQSFTYLVTRGTDKDRLVGDEHRIQQLSCFVRLFQGANSITRQVGHHVEYESTEWVGALEVLSFVYELLNTFAVGIEECSQQKREQAIQVVSKIIHSWVFSTADQRYFEAIPMPEFTKIQAPVDFQKTQELRVLDYSIQTSGVDFYHPLHVLLSYFIQHGNVKDSAILRNLLIPCLDENPLQTENDIDDYLYLLFDYNFRVLSFLSQVKGGLWVRNGLNLRLQAGRYRDSIFRDTGFSRDIFMAQTALALFNPQSVIPRLLYRFDLHDWFGKKEYKETASIYLMEDFIHYLITFMMERNYLVGLSEKEAKKKDVRRRIIQCLGFKPLPFSDLCEEAELSEDDLVEALLEELADFRPPSGVRDTGLFALKSKFLHEFDPFDIYFSSAKMGEAQSILKKSIAEKKGMSPEEVVLEPVLTPIDSGIFTDIGAFTRTATFAAFVYDILHMQVTSTGVWEEGEVILSLVLRLLHIAASDDHSANHTNGSTFVSVMCTDFEVGESGFLNLLGAVTVDHTKSSVALMLYHMSTLGEFHSVKATILRIFELLQSKDPALVGSLFEERLGTKLSFNDESKSSSFSTTGGNKSSALKKLARKKQQKVLLKMQKKQKAFSDKHKADIPDKTPEAETEEVPEVPNHTQCIMCLTPCDAKKLFGVLGFIGKSNASREVPFEDKDWVLQAFGMQRELDEQEPEEEPKVNAAWDAYQAKFNADNKVGPGFPSKFTDTHTVISSCNHVMHHSCYNSFMEERISTNRNSLTSFRIGRKQQAQCPLCNSLTNTFIPTPWEDTTFNCYNESSDLKFETFFEKSLKTDTLSTENYERENVLQNLSKLVGPQYADVMGPEESEVLNTSSGTQRYLAISEAIVNTAKNISKSFNPTLEVMSQNHVGSSIAATVADLELYLRGQGYSDGNYSKVVVDQIKESSMTSLKTLVRFGQVFTSMSSEVDSVRQYPQTVTTNTPVIEYSRDLPFRADLSPFEDVVKAAFCECPRYNIDLIWFVQTYFVGEMAKTIGSLVRCFSSHEWWTSDLIMRDMPRYDMPSGFEEVMAKIVGLVCADLYIKPDSNTFSTKGIYSVLYSWCLRVVTPFLRRCAIFCHALSEIKRGEDIDMEDTASMREADKLCSYLNIISFDDVLLSWVAEPEGINERLQSILHKWLSTLPPISIPFPNVVKLLRIPKRLDEFYSMPLMRLSEDSSRTKEPTVCLFCSAVVCVHQHYNVTTTNECYDHVINHCGRTVGMFLQPRRGMILLMHGDKGAFIPAPYLDMHGESDESR